MAEEQKLQKKILDKLKGIPNCKAVKITVSNEKGIPDIHICWKGYYIVLEIKASSGKVASAQKSQLRRYADAGALSAVVSSLDEFDMVMRNLEKIYD
jgi:hypothetical protein